MIEKNINTVSLLKGILDQRDPGQTQEDRPVGRQYDQTGDGHQGGSLPTGLPAASGHRSGLNPETEELTLYYIE